MADAIVKIKIMPESPSTDLNKIKENAKKKIEAENGILNKYEEEEIAFGLKALIATILWPDDKDTGKIENIFKEQEGVSNADIIDHRRAFG